MTPAAFCRVSPSPRVNIATGLTANERVELAPDTTRSRCCRPAPTRCRASCRDFSRSKYDRIVVNVGSDSTVNFKLKQGVAESVTVTAAAPLVDTTTSEVSSVVE